MRLKIAVILHWLIFISTFAAVLANFIGGPDSLGAFRFKSFRYFTTDSNIVAMIGSLLWLIYLNREAPRWVSVFRFAGTVSVTITLLTVIFFLAPSAAARNGMTGFLSFYKGNVFVLHLTTPLLAIAAQLLSSSGELLTRRECLWGMAPVLLYAIVYAVMVAGLKVWRDWYGFTFGGKYRLIPIVMLVMMLFAAGVSLLLQKLQEICCR